MKKVLTGGIAAALLAGAIAVPLSTGSSHREAPNIMLDPTADNTDVYAFVPKDRPKDVVIAANWVPNEVPAGGPNFYRFDDRARYYINVDNTGDGKPDVRFRYQFKTKLRNPNSFLYSLPGVETVTDRKLNVVQIYDLHRELIGENGEIDNTTRLGKDLVVAPSNVGPKTFPTYERLIRQANRTDLDGGRASFAGQREDPFFVDLGATFDALNIRKGTGNEGLGKDDFSGQGVQSTVLRVPQNNLTTGGQDVSGPDDPNAVIGVWSSTERKKLEVTNADFKKNKESSGDFVQVSRLGNPLVNEVVVPIGKKDLFNRTTPDEDAERFGAAVLKPELAAVLNALFQVNAPEDNRTDIVQALLQGIPGLNQLDKGDSPLPTDTLKLNMGVPPAQNENRFGVIGGDNAGFPNGRRLADDVVDIELQVVAGFLKGNKVPLGDGVDRNNREFLPEFPYLAPLTNGLDSDPTNRIEPQHEPVPAGGGS